MSKGQPLITFYTPTYRRPGFLAQNIASVRSQSMACWEHVIIPDLIGRGIGAMFHAITEHLDKIHGRYVYILQDDDRLMSDQAVAAFCSFARQNGYPPVVICKNTKCGRILPDRWGQEPELGHIDLGSYIVRDDVFKANAHRFGNRYEGDFDFISALWCQGLPFAWWDFLFAEALQVGKGKPEHA